ncbi:MAG TPA: glutaredoxin family protein [Candidatus Nanoarchaeia archaeon]|nr:glutaredoxin family protein [Candidatus Nanoarchaeia archaeon]
MTDVKVYSTPQCPWCHKAKEWLTENKVKFKDYNVAEDMKAAKHMVEMTGQRGVPVIEIGEDVIVGFDEDALKKALKIK